MVVAERTPALEQGPVGGVRVTLHALAFGIGPARNYEQGEDHRVAVTGGDEHGLVGRAQTLKQRIVRFALCACGVVLVLSGCPFVGSSRSVDLEKVRCRVSCPARWLVVDAAKNTEVSAGSAVACRWHNHLGSSPVYPGAVPLGAEEAGLMLRTSAGRISAMSCAIRLPIEYPRRSR